jgi:8-oxo-dGTP pyrophosphatase MutT (NUDIX family)
MSSDPFERVAGADLARLGKLAQEFAESGAEPAAPREAATVVLLRPDRTVFLIRRSRGMAFGGMWAFPGGAWEPGDGSGPALDIARRTAIREVYEETGVQLIASELTPWHRWLTPEFERRRYDTWFFLAAMPEGQTAAMPEFEADQVRWLTPEEALAGYAAERLPMLPPTVVTFAELSSYETVADMLTAERDVSTPLMPSL